ncbi:hypothetical protein PT2222_200032 [Paraburkholderia tropica]
MFPKPDKYDRHVVNGYGMKAIRSAGRSGRAFRAKQYYAA